MGLPMPREESPDSEKKRCRVTPGRGNPTESATGLLLPQQVRVGSYSHRGNTVVRGMIIYESRLGGFRDKIRLIDLPRGLCFLVTGFLRFFHPVAFDFCSSQAHSGAFAVDSDASPNKSQKLGLHVSATSAGYIRRHDMAKPTTIKIRLNSSAGSTLNTKKARSSKIDLL